MRQNRAKLMNEQSLLLPRMPSKNHILPVTRKIKGIINTKMDLRDFEICLPEGRGGRAWSKDRHQKFCTIVSGYGWEKTRVFVATLLHASARCGCVRLAKKNEDYILGTKKIIFVPIFPGAFIYFTGGRRE